jgi:hypothetical protein
MPSEDIYYFRGPFAVKSPIRIPALHAWKGPTFDADKLSKRFCKPVVHESALARSPRMRTACRRSVEERLWTNRLNFREPCKFGAATSVLESQMKTVGPVHELLSHRATVVRLSTDF